MEEAKKKRIVLVMPTLMQGGAERVMSELANEWTNNGHQVKIILLVKSTVFYTLNSKVELVSLNFDNDNTHIITRSVRSLTVLFQLRKQIKSSKPDFVMSFMDKYNVITIVSSFFLKVNVFISDRANPYEIIPKPVEIARKMLYRFAKGIIAQTSLAKEVLFAKTKNKNIMVIPNPINGFSVTAQSNKENIILNVGRLVREKGQHYLIEMMASLQSDNWKLVILGDGPLRETLQNQIDKLNLNGKVFLEGTVSNVDEWLSKSSIFAFSSISEGFPNALVEAMASGLPSVSFDCDAGPRDIIDNNKNGILIPLGDTESFTKAVQNLIDDSNSRKEIGIEAAKISEVLNIKSIAEKYLQFCSGK
ncbi:MAG: glycosyltransferase family 4 protein [Flavobacterium sp.]